MKKTYILKNIISALLITIITYSYCSAQNTVIKRTELQRHDLSIDKHEVIQVRIDFAYGEAFGMHSHPGEEIIYILEGILEYTIENKSPVNVKAGEGYLFRQVLLTQPGI